MRTLTLALGLFTACYLTSCDYASNTVRSVQAYDIPLPNDTLIDNQAICLWDGAGLRDGPGRGEKLTYLSTIYFGEQVELLGESELVEATNRTYLKVRLSDGEEGWVHQYLFAENAYLAAVMGEAEIYRRPDIMTFKDDKFERGEVVTVMEEKGDWIRLVGMERKKSGWITRKKLLSTDLFDIRLALKYVRAVNFTSSDKQAEQLENIISSEKQNPSSLLDVVKQRLNEVTEENKDEAISMESEITDIGVLEQSISP
ncbi:MAG: hypothetical protein AAFR66_14945 [Bacteroidota bacterium]